MMLKIQKQARVTMWSRESIQEKPDTPRPVMDRLNTALKDDETEDESDW